MPIPPSCIEKFNWAHEHFQRLHAEVKSFFDVKPYEVRANPNTDCTEYRFYVDFTRPIPGPRWGLMLGDGIHCLRSTLDHSVYAIAVKESATDPPPKFRSLEFLITRDEDHWNKSVWHIETLSGPVIAAIKGLQEHANPAEFFMRPLGGLQEMDNADKHRRIHLAVVIPTFSESNVSGLIPGQQCQIEFHVRPLKPQTPFATLKLDRPTPNVQVGSNLTLEIGLPHIRENGRETTILVWSSVDAMTQAVTYDLNALAPYC